MPYASITPESKAAWNRSPGTDFSSKLGVSSDGAFPLPFPADGIPFETGVFADACFWNCRSRKPRGNFVNELPRLGNNLEYPCVVFTVSDYNNGPRREITFPMFGDGIFTQDGAPWKRSRDILRPQFLHRHYENLEVFRGPLEDLLDAMPKQGVVDLQPLFFRFTLDITTAFLFGESVRSLNSVTHRFAEAFDTAQQVVAKRLRLFDFCWLIGGAEFKRSCDEVKRFADEIIDRNLSKRSNDREKFQYSDRTALRGQIINMLTAGRDTTACLLSWTL